MKNDNISVLLISRLFHPVFTGAGIRFLRYSPGLHTRGIDLSILTCTRGEVEDGNRTPTNTITLEMIHGLPVWRASTSFDSFWQRELAFISYLQSHCRTTTSQIDLLHVLSPSPYYFPNYTRLKKLNLPIIISHTLHAGTTLHKWKQLMRRLLAIMSYQIADCIVTNSTAGSQWLTNQGITKPIIMIPNGVDLIRFSPATSFRFKQELRQRLGLDFSNNTRIVLFVGSLSQRKGIDLLLGAWRIVSSADPNAVLVLVGPLDTEARSLILSIDRTDGENQICDRIVLTGKVEHVEDYYRAADIFVFPSQREGMPNALMEAFSSGLPCIVTPFIGLSDEFGNPGEHFILVNRAEIELAHAILELLGDQDMCQHFGYRARSWAEQNLSLEHSLDMYAKLYRQWTERS